MNGNRTKNNSKGMIAMALAVILFAGFVYWRIQVKANAPPEKAFVLVVPWDTSGSVSSTLTCDALVAAVKDELSEADRKMEMGKDSRFEWLVIGTASSSRQAKLVLDIAIPSLKSRNGPMRRKGGQSREEFFGSIHAACTKEPGAESSPIFNSVQLAIEHMRGRGCGTPQAECVLRIGSDGLENVDRRIYDYLVSADPKAVPPAVLDNSIAIRTTWCGWAQRGPNGPETSSQEVMERWRQLFNSPMTFPPYCAASSNQTASK